MIYPVSFYFKQREAGYRQSMKKLFHGWNVPLLPVPPHSLFASKLRPPAFRWTRVCLLGAQKDVFGVQTAPKEVDYPWKRTTCPFIVDQTAAGFEQLSEPNLFPNSAFIIHGQYNFYHMNFFKQVFRGK